MSDDDVPLKSKKFLLGLAQAIVMGALIGVSITADLNLTEWVLCWAAIFGVIFLFNRWKSR